MVFYPLILLQKTTCTEIGSCLYNAASELAEDSKMVRTYCHLQATSCQKSNRFLSCKNISSGCLQIVCRNFTPICLDDDDAKEFEREAKACQTAELKVEMSVETRGLRFDANRTCRSVAKYSLKHTTTTGQPGSSSSSGVPSGAIVAVVVSVLLVGLVICILLIWMHRRRAR